MLFVRALCLAVVGFGTSTLAAPIDAAPIAAAPSNAAPSNAAPGNAAPDNADVAFDAISKAIQNAASPQAVQDICSGIPFEERRRRRECEEDRQDGDVWGECLELHRTGGHDTRCGDYKTQPAPQQGGGYGGYQGGYQGSYQGGSQGGYGGYQGGSGGWKARS